MLERIGFHNVFRVRHFRAGELLNEFTVRNAVTDEGIRYLENVGFNGSGVQAQIDTWYLGLVDNTGFTQFLAGDSAAQIGGTNQWSEMAGYSGTNRILWDAGAAALRAITNAVSTDFAMTATNTVKGIFLNSSQVRASTTGILFSTAAFTTASPVVSGDTLKVTYTIEG